jgi:CrcB protein
MTPAYWRRSFSFEGRKMKPAVDLMTWMLVGAAGAIGVLLRFAFGERLARVANGPFPWQTFAVNGLGCLAIGLIAGALERGAAISPQVRVAIMVGFLGGFTTFSSYALESVRLMQAAHWPEAMGYVLLSNGCGILAVFLGHQVTQRVG